MFRLIKQVFIALWSFGRSLTTKCVSFNNEPCMISSTFTDLNPIKFNCYLFIIGLDKCNQSYNVVGDLSKKICVQSKTKLVNVKVFNMITRINEVKTMVKHISCNTTNAISMVQHVIQIKNGIMINFNVSIRVWYV